MEFDKFAIGFDLRDRERPARALGRDPRRPACGRTARWCAASRRRGRPGTACPAVATHSWTGAALAALEFFELRGKTVLCPSNTFMADAARDPGRGRARRVRRLQPRRPLHVVRRPRAQGRRAQAGRGDARPHRRSHRLRGRQDRRALRRRGDHPDRGLRARPRRLLERPQAGQPTATPGIWSFAPTKTISTGEGGLLVSRHPELVEFARALPQLRQARLRAARPQLPDERVHRRARAPRRPSGSRRSSPGRTRSPATQLDPIYPARVELPEGMVSGYYKYIVFEPLERSTGQGLRRALPPVMGRSVELPNSDWVADEPLVRPALLPARRGARARGGLRLRVLVTGGAGFIGSHVVDKLIAHGHEPRIFDLVASPYHAAGTVDVSVGDLTDPDRRRRGDAPAATRSPTSRRWPTSTRWSPTRAAPTASTCTEPSRCSRRPAARASGASSTRARSGSTATPPGAEPHDEDTPLVLPPHLYTATKLAGEMYCRSYETLYGVPAHDPALRHPLRPARAPGRGRAGVHQPRPGRRAADDLRRRQPEPPVRLRRGPRRRASSPALAPAGAGRSLQPRRRGVGERAPDRRHGPRARRGGAARPRPGAARRPAASGRSPGARAAAELGWSAQTSFARRCPPLPRLADASRPAARPSRARPRSPHGSAAAVARQESAEL